MIQITKSRKVEVQVTINLKDDEGTDCFISKKNAEENVDDHALISAVLASSILHLELGDPESFLRIVVGILGSGRKTLSETLGEENDRRILQRFAEILKDAEEMNNDNYEV